VMSLNSLLHVARGYDFCIYTWTQSL